jgi:hypothetical protein
MIEEQSRKTYERIDALLLVGGFAGSDYLFTRVKVRPRLRKFPSAYRRLLPVFQEQFASRIKVIARPADADTATARGAAQYGLARKLLVSSVISPRSYFMRVCSPSSSWMRVFPSLIRRCGFPRNRKIG